MLDRRKLQRDILSGAVKRSTGFVLPLPISASVDRQVVAELLEEMIANKFIIERPVLQHEAFWLADDARNATVLVISGLGVRSLSADPSSNILRRSSAGAIDPGKLPVDPAGTPDTRPQPVGQADGKLQLILRALQNNDGITIAELSQLTSWKPKSVRAALSTHIRTRLGLNLQVIEQTGQPNRYRIGH